MTAYCDLRHVLDLLTASGIRPEEAVTALNLPENHMTGAPGDLIPFADYFRVRTYIAARVSDETCNLSARQLLPGSTDFVMSHLPSQGTLADVMRLVAKSYNLLHGGEYNYVEIGDDKAVFHIDDKEFPYTSNLDKEQIYFAVESTLLFLHALLTIVAPHHAARGLTSLSVRQEDVSKAPHLTAWPVTIEYGAAHYELAYHKEQAMASVLLPDKAELNTDKIEQQILHMLEHGLRLPVPDTNNVSDAVRDMLGRGTIEQCAIADLLEMSAATLRRRLAAEGQTFRQLRQEVLDHRAQEFIYKGMPIGDISDRLGFSDVRSFNRAFKAWNGVTPKAFQGARGKERVQDDTQV